MRSSNFSTSRRDLRCSATGGATYRARIAAMNRAGWGKYSKFSERVKLSVPCAPECPRIRIVDATSIRVSWKTVTCQPPVVGYTITVHQGGQALRYGSKQWGANGRESAEPVQVVHAPAHARSVAVKRLQPKAEYCVQVSAENHLGLGDASPLSDGVILDDVDATAFWPPLRLDLAPSVPMPRRLEASQFQAVRKRIAEPPAQAARDDAVEHALESAGFVVGAGQYRRSRADGLTDRLAAAMVWMGDGEEKGVSVYQKLNRVLLGDDELQLGTWMRFIGLLVEHLSWSAPSGAVLAWRGSKLTRAQAANLRIGEIISPPMFVSACLGSKEDGEVYQDFYTVRIQVPANCRSAGVLEPPFGSEVSVVLAPYTPMRVRDVTAEIIEVEVLDIFEPLTANNFETAERVRAFPI